MRNLLLADRLAEVDLENHSFEDPQLASMERLNRRMMLRQLISAYLDWAAIAARGNGRLAVTVTRMLDDIPENRDELRGLALGMIQHLADDVDTLTPLSSLPISKYCRAFGEREVVRCHCPWQGTQRLTE